MATNKYIGARYVPLIVGTWTPNTSYEALSVVMYQGDSYISKVPVPSGVAITNTAYWVKCADYNAQWAAFQQNWTEFQTEMRNTVDEAIDDMESDTDTAIGNMQTATNSAIGTMQSATTTMENRVNTVLGNYLMHTNVSGVVTQGVTIPANGINTVDFEVFSASNNKEVKNIVGITGWDIPNAVVGVVTYEIVKRDDNAVVVRATIRNFTNSAVTMDAYACFVYLTTCESYV